MNKLEKLAYLAIIIGSILAVILVSVILAQFFISENISVGSDWSLIVTAITTSVLVVITALQMREARKVRLELVRPSLSLEPSLFNLDGGFIRLLLANTGMTARNVEINVTYKEKKESSFHQFNCINPESSNSDGGFPRSWRHCYSRSEV